MSVAAEAQPQYDPEDKPRVASFRRPMPPVFTDKVEEQRYRKGRLAMAARIFHDEGWGIGCGVQMSVRDALDPAALWILPAGRPLPLMTSADLIKVRIVDGHVLVPGSADRGYDINAFAIHAAIYADRPDIGGIIHGHTPYAQAFSRAGKAPSMIVQDSCTFYNNIHVLPFSAGIAAQDDPEAISKTLGKGKGLILQNRGLLLAGAAIECALSYYIRLENLCRAELMCEAAIKGRGGKMVLVGDEEVKFTYDNTGSEHHAWLMARPYYARFDRTTGGAMVI